jgi:ABC-type dipeptide/oligopeptide/nickel transport system permease subunit
MTVMESDARAQVVNHLTVRGRLGLWFATNWQQFKVSWRIFSHNRLAMLGVVLILIYALAAIAHPILLQTVWPKGVYNPETGYDMDIFPHPSPPGPGHLFGTDALGRDVLSMLMAATRPTLVLALAAAATTALISTLVGAISAFFRGPIDGTLSLLADVSLLLPAPLMMVIIGGTGEIGPLEFGLLYGLLSGIGGSAIVMRAHALTLISKPFIEASRVAGGGPVHIIVRHLIPHMLPLAAVQMMLSVVGAVFADGFVAFLGLSRVRLNWGSLIYSSFSNLAISTQITWNVLIPAALAISLFAASFYFIARGLHEVAEPRLRER